MQAPLDFRRKVASRPIDLQSVSSISSIASQVVKVRNISIPQKLLAKTSDFEYSADGSLEYEKGRRFLHGQHEVLVVGGKDGMDARQSARYYFQRSAEAGHAVGTAMYGMCCELGIGGEKDYRLAAKLYLIALRRGSSMGHCLLASLGDRTPLGTAISGSESRKWRASCPDAVNAVEGLYSLYEACETFQVLEAIYLMGNLSETGCGMVQDSERAAQYYRNAATEEFPPACTALGYCYERGNGVEMDLDEAQHWYEIAAKRGDPHGMVNLAEMLELGRPGFPPDPYSAFGWCKRAAEMESPLGWYALGRCYELAIGTGFQQDRAADLYETAANSGHAEAQLALARCYTFGTGRARSSHLAFQWTESSAEGGLLEAALALGQMLFRGQVCPMDREEAVRLFRRAALQGSIEGCYELGLCYRDGHGVPANDYESIRWIKKAAIAKHPAAEFDMHLFYFDGTASILKDKLQSLYWLERSAEHGYTEAQITLADYFADPRLGDNMVTMNHYAAHKWYQRAAKEGNPYAQYQLAVQYMNGLPKPSPSDTRNTLKHTPNTRAIEDNTHLNGFVRDLALAAYWMERSAEQKFDAAEKALPVVKALLFKEQKDRHIIEIDETEREDEIPQLASGRSSFEQHKLSVRGDATPLSATSITK